MHYVIGDIHGCYNEFIEMISKIEDIDINANFILVGDIIDRGPNTIEMLNWAMHNIKPNGKYQMVLGNHEDMIIDWHNEYKKRKNKDGCRYYPITSFDFDETLASHDMLNEAYVLPIITFFKKLPLYIKLNIMGVTYIIAHAFAPGFHQLELTDCDIRDKFLWYRADSKENYPEDAILIHGHTPTIINGSAEITYSNNIINIDCGCVFKSHGGKLAAICLETLNEYYV